MIADARASGASRWLRSNCLACPDRAGKSDSKRSFSFHSPTGFYHCKRCGLRGRASEYVDTLSEDVQRQLDRLEDDGAEESKELPKGFYLLDEEPAKSSTNGRAAREFLDRRGITADKRAAYGIGAVLVPGNKWYGRVIIPLRAEDGSLYGFIGRSWFKKHEMPYLYSCGLQRAELLFGGGELYRETDDPLIVVEGTMDAIFLGRDCAAILGMPSGIQQEMFLESRRPVVLALDGDAWVRGWSMAQQLRSLSLCQGGHGRYAALRLPGGTDPDEIDPDYLFQAAREAVR
jgi:DNA primase